MTDYDPLFWICAGAAMGGFITWAVLRSKRQDAYRHGLDEGA
jgi:hypothetical protein